MFISISNFAIEFDNLYMNNPVEISFLILIIKKGDIFTQWNYLADEKFQRIVEGKN